MLAAAPAAVAESALGPARASAFLDFRIVVPAMVRAEARAEPASMAVTQGDAERGYVDIADASAVTLTSNARSGFALGVEFDTALVRAVDVRMMGATVNARRTGDLLQIPVGRLVARAMRVGYRIFLAPGARAGNYRWPLALTYSAAPA
jgi:hypothetical protein